MTRRTGPQAPGPAAASAGGGPKQLPGQERSEQKRAGLHQIGEVAEAVGLSLRTIRHYEEVGLIRPSGRTPGGFRLYTDDDIERLHLVKHMKPLEFTLDEMRHLLEARDALAAGVRDRVARAELLDRLAGYASIAEQRCAQLRAQLGAAESMVALLRQETDPNRIR